MKSRSLKRSFKHKSKSRRRRFVRLSTNTSKSLPFGDVTTRPRSFSKNISKTSLKEIQMWVGHLKCENKYKHIDNLFSNNVGSLEAKLKSKSLVVESLKKEKIVYENSEIKLPLNKVVDVANKTVNDYLSKLDESEKKDLLKVLKEDESKLEIEFDVLKESVISRLSNLKKDEVEDEVLNTINETMSKVEKETFSRDGYLKLKRLNNNI